MTSSAVHKKFKNVTQRNFLSKIDILVLRESLQLTVIIKTVTELKNIQLKIFSLMVRLETDD